MIKGIDVAYYDRRMNWALYNWNFAYIKVSEGLVIDSEFHTHWAAAKGHTYRGGYHFFRQFVDPKQSAMKCIEYMGGDLGELPLWFDLEVTAADAADRINIVATAKSWLSWYEQLTGVRPIIYTALNILYDLDASADISWMRNYKLCLAQYRYDNLSVDARTRILHGILTGAITYTFPAIPSPFSRVTMAQWTGKGSPADVPGYYLGTGGKLAVDFDFYNGDEQAFLQEFNLQPLGTEPQEPTGDTMRIIKGTARGSVKRRDGVAGAEFVPPRYLAAGDQIEASENSVQWLHLTKINNNPVVGTEWVSAGSAQQYITWDWVDVATPPVEPPVEPPAEPADEIIASLDVDVRLKVNGVQYVGTAMIDGVVLQKE